MKSGVIIAIVLVVVSVLVGAYFLAGYKVSSNSGGNVAPINGVSISGFAFNPATLTVGVGDTVTWKNEDSAPHTIVSDSGSEISSPSLSNGQTYEHKFGVAGIYEYHCSIHPGMKAKIIVQ
ncbi:MAG: cupredoxin family copper-binding protein [archaeon]